MNTLLAGGTAVTVLAKNNFGDNQPDGVAGPLGLFIIVLLAIATVLLVRNMNKRLRRLPESFPDPAAAPGPARGMPDRSAPTPRGPDDGPAGTS